MMAKFGTVEWQNEMIAKARNRLMKGEKLDSIEAGFLSVQLDHQLRHGIITQNKYKKMTELLKKVM